MTAPIKTARQLTFTYFAIVAFAIITFHFAMIDTMIETMEKVYAKERITKDLETAKEYFQHNSEKVAVLSKMSRAYLGDDVLPESVIFPDNTPNGEVVELIEGYLPDLEMFGIKDRYKDQHGKTYNLYLIHYDEVYEASEGKVFKNQFIQLAMSLLLLAVSMLVVMLISRRLTQPLASLTKYLEKRSPDDLSSIPIPDGIVTREIVQLVNQLNLLQEKNEHLVERERAFNRRASHELRTPLMVIRGAANLLKRKVTSDFEIRQVNRVEHATQEMTEYIETLLMLSQIDRDTNEQFQIAVSKSTLQEWLTHFSDLHLNGDNKLFQFSLTMPENAHFELPMPAFKIIFLNLLKNAFEATAGCTENVSSTPVISIKVSDHQLQITDSGSGLEGSHNPDGHGLGLVIVRDICNQYAYQFALSDLGHTSGCIASMHR